MSVLRILRNVAVLVILAVGFFASAPGAAAAKKKQTCYLRFCPHFPCTAGWTCVNEYCCPVKK